MNVHHAQMSTLVIEVCLVHGFCFSVHFIISLRILIENIGCGIMSVSHTPSLGYGTLIQYTRYRVHCNMYGVPGTAYSLTDTVYLVQSTWYSCVS